MKKENMGFFKKIFLVVTDFRTYPFLVKYEKFYKSILYLLGLIFFTSIILTVNITLKVNNTLKMIAENYDEIVPEFELTDGILDVKKTYRQKLDEEFFMVLDTNYTYEEYKKTDEYLNLVIYDNVLLVNKDKITLELYGEPNESIPDFKNVGININKNELYQIIKEFLSNQEYKLYTILAIFISIYVLYLKAMFIKILFLTFIISIICLARGIMLNYCSYAKIAIYSYTLPLILDVLATCLVGYGKDYTYYTTLALTYVYIIYAIRAIRLDAFIMMFSKNVKIKNAPIEFKKELDKYNELINGENEETDQNQDKDKDKKE